MDDDPGKLIKDLFAAVEQKNGSNLTPDQVSRVSLKLGEMLGNPDSHEVTQNEKGQILNEDGLPIIEITEQAGPEQPSSSNGVSPPFSEDLPVWALAETEKARRRAERERVLDMLEEEERLDEEREAVKEEESRAARRKRLEAAREVQKAMGRALVKNVRDFKEKEEQKKNALLETDNAVGAEESGRLRPKKSVSFDLPPEESPVSPGPQQDWGDVTPARLQPKQSLTPGTHGPMKFQVVERYPQKLQWGSSSKDSDDESDPEPVPESDEDTDLMERAEFNSDESTEDGGDFEFQEDETDLDAARDQREIALAYYEKRDKFAAQAAAALSAHSHVEEDPWDKPEVPLEASLSGDRPKPAISKFRADRIVASSTSLDGFVVPASQSALMQDAVRLGKLEGDQLLCGPDDSDDDLKEIMGLLKQGEVENVGPRLQSESSSQATEEGFSSLPPPKSRNKASRFKINRGGAAQPAEQTAENGPRLTAVPATSVVANVTERRGILQLEPSNPARSTSSSPVPDTPLTVVERSSPKLPSSGGILATTEFLHPTHIPCGPVESPQSTSSTVYELASASDIVRGGTPRPLVAESPVIIDSPSFAPRQDHSPAFHSMIIDSPDFPPPLGVATMPPMIIDSPDFPPPKGVASMASMIIDSPDFPPPKGVSPTSANPSINAPVPPLVDPTSFPVGSRNPRPPRVMSSQVIERSANGVNQQQASAPGKKVSRFAAERR